MGQFEISLAVSELDNPIERKKLSFGKSTTSGFTIRIVGNDLTTLMTCSLVKPLFLSSVSTESGLSEDDNFTNLDFDLADSNDNPHEFMRYETVNDFNHGLFSLAETTVFLSGTEHSVLLSRNLSL